MVARSPQLLLILIVSWASLGKKAIAQPGGGGGGGGGAPTSLGGEFTMNFTAASPNTYDHKTGGGAFNDGTNGVDDDVVESLEGGDFSCQDTVTYLVEINAGSALPGSHTIELELIYLADTTGQPGVGHDQITNVAINYGQVENGDNGAGSNPGTGSFGLDSGINDDGGSTATLISQSVSNPPPLQGNGSELTGVVQVDDLEADETVILRIDVSLSCAADSGPTGNIQGSTLSAKVVDDDSTINVGRQTIPFKQIGNIAGAGEPLLEFQKTVTSDLTGGDTVGSEQINAIQGDTVRYLYKVSNLGSGSLFDLEIIDDNGTPGDTSDDFTVDFNNILSGVGNLADVDGDGDNPELRSVSEVILYADVPLTNSGTITNTAAATGASGDGGNAATLSVANTATVVVEEASFVAPIIDLDGDDSSGATNNDFNTGYTLGGNAVKVVDADNADTALDTVITDDSTLSQAVITLSNDPAIAGDTLTIDPTALNAIASGAITADTSVANQITLSGNADIADYEAALELIEFSTTSTDTTARTVTFQVTDTDAQASNTATTNITVSEIQAEKDYGDAPDSYGDASHDIPSAPALYLGNVIPDSEASTQLSSSPSTGDDDDGNDDEDAFVALPNVPLVNPSIPGLDLGRQYNLNVPVTNNTGGDATLHAWIDFNQNGKFEAGEHQSASIANGQDSANLNWDLPLTTLIGDTHARFRLTSDTLTDSTSVLDPLTILGVDERSLGNATDGEVEDYSVSVSVPLFDYGDAPDANSGTEPGDYQTTESDGGPSHVVVDTIGLNFSLGNNIDGDDGSLQSDNADADDLDSANVDLIGTLLGGGSTNLNDEDGVDVDNLPALTADAGLTYTVPVTVRNNIPLLNAFVVGYIDFNRDGDFDDPGEKSTTATATPVTSISASGSTDGSSTSASGSVDNTGLRTVELTFTVPAGVTPGETYARFRMGSIQEIVESATTISVIGSNGEINNGEIEDYKIEIAEATNSGNNETTDYGDAPDSYRDASHEISSSPNLYIGSIEPDGEADTQLTSDESKGDDDDGNDDEDGFVILPNVPLVDPSVSNLSVGREYSLNVPVTNTTGTDATLHAWIDFNQNGQFEAGEYQSATVVNGATSAILNWDSANILGLDALTVPLTTLAGDTHARFRLTTDELTDKTNITDLLDPLIPLNIDDRSIGNATDGEVEDYPVSIAVPLFDYGDAPDTDTGTGTGNYQTTESDGGPTHIVMKDPLGLLHLSLGSIVDGDAGDLQNAEANADDLDTKDVDLLGTLLSGGDTGLDDEDGVASFPTLTATPGQTYTVPVTVRNNIPLLNAYLAGYIDFNQDGDFDDPGERSATVTVPSDLLTIAPGLIALDTTGEPRTFDVTFTVPEDIAPGDTYARFRLGSIQEIVESATGASVSTSNGQVNNGEVEDYQIAIASNNISIGGQVINDVNYNGVLDNGETGLDNVPVKLYNAQNELQDTVTTANDGEYNFADVAPGQYYVEIEPPNNTVLSPQGKGGVNSDKSDFNRITNRTRRFNWRDGDNLNLVAALAVDTDGDLIADYNEQGDRDGDGVPDSEEIDPEGFFYDETDGRILTGGSISVTGPSPTSVDMRDTGTDGSYQFFGTEPGIYTISVNSPPGYQPSTLCPDTPGPFDPTGGPDPTSLGSSEDGTTGFLVDFDCADNIFYLTFDLEAGDPFVIDNNLPFVPVLDYGDAPDSYGTDATAGNSGSEPVGASHVITTGIHLGTAPDAEGDAATPLDGTGDGVEDDGITLPTLNDSDTSYTIPAGNITATGTGTLHAWIDFDGNGSFDPGEYQNVTVTNGAVAGDLIWNSISLGTGDTYARFRFTSDSSINNTTPGGNASDGEVEDYQIAIASAPVDLSTLTCPSVDNAIFATGNADSQNVTRGTVIAPENALGVPDNNVATLDSGFASTIVLNLTDLVPENSKIKITLTRGTSNSLLAISASTDGGNTFTGLERYGDSGNPATTIAGGTVGVLEEIEYTVPAGGASSLRMTRFSGEIQIDGVAYTEICASSPTLDLDGDDSSGITGNDFETSYIAGGNNIKITDADTADETQDTVITAGSNRQIEAATIELITPQPGDQLTLNGTLPGTITQDSANSTATRIVLTGITSTADYEAALELIEFGSTSSDTNDRTINVTLTDNSQNDTNTAVTTIKVSNNPPTVDLDGDNPNDYTNEFTPGRGAVAAADTDVVVTDDSGIIASATITLKDIPDGVTERLIVDETAGNTVTGITASSYDTDTGILTLTGNAPVADYQAVLATLQYNNFNNVVTPSDRNIEVTLTDAGGLISNQATSKITITPVYQVTGTVYQDGNTNDVFDPPPNIVIDADNDFPFSSSVVVRLFSSDGSTELDVTATDSNGEYTFNNVPDGDYQIQVDTNTVAAFYDIGTPNDVPITISGATLTDNDFGFDLNIRNDATLACPDNAPPAFELNWDNVTWNDGDFGPNTFTNVSGSGIDMSVSFTDIDGIMFSGFPRSRGTFTGGLQPPQTNIQAAMDTTANGQFVTGNISFTQALQDVNFFVLDVDSGTPTSSPSWIDEVEITGYDGTTPVIPILVGSQIHTIDGNKATALPGFPINSDQSGGNVGVAFLNPIDRIEIRYVSGAGSNNAAQIIGIFGSISSCGVAAPTLDLDQNSTGNDFDTSFGIGTDSSIPVTGTTVDISDDKVFIDSATITLTNRPDGTNENISIDPTAGGTVFGVDASAYDPTTGIINLTSNGSISITDYEAILATLQYNNNVANPNLSDRLIEVQVRDSDNLASNVALSTIVMNQNSIELSGTVFEDINYGGGAGRNFTTAETSATNSGFAVNGTNRTGVENARVELYSYDGIDPSLGLFVEATTTDADGKYSFNVDNGDYLIRVVNDTIISNRSEITSNSLAVQTYRFIPSDAVESIASGEVTDEVGGANPAVADAGSITTVGDLIPTNAQSVTTVTVDLDPLTNADFGFNFDTIVNTNDSGQGSLRQFIINSNELDNANLAQDLPATITPPVDKEGNAVTLTDYETSIFMIPDPNSDSRVTAGTGVGQINLTATPPDGGSSAFVIDISATGTLMVQDNPFTSIDGRTQSVNIPSIANTSNLTVGSNETTGSEIIITSSSNGNLIQGQVNNTIFHSLGIISQNNANSIGMVLSNDGSTLAQAADTGNVIVDNLTVIAPNNCGIEGVSLVDSVIRDSVIRDSGATNVCDNIQLQRGSNRNLIEGNLILRAVHYGIDIVLTGNSDNIIRGNQIVGNGVANADNQNGGIGIRSGTNTTIENNVIRENIGDGINITNVDLTSTSNKITQNSIYNNGELGIDLGTGNSGDGATSNDSQDSDPGINQLQNFPTITSIATDGTNYTIDGTLDSTPSSNFEIELFSNAVCNADISGAPQAERFGEGESYHLTIPVTTDASGQATFTATIPIAEVAGRVITSTATATTSNDTSEFSPCLATTPDLLLVKRITAINPGQSDERLFEEFVDDPTDEDNNVKWIGSSGGTNTYTLGTIDGGQVTPGDVIEYTIYYLSNGSDTAQNVLVCDPIPENTEFIPNDFDTLAGATGGISGTDRGLVWEYNGNIESLTNNNDGDNGYYFAPGIDPTSISALSNVNCGGGANDNGSVVVDLDNLSPAINPGSPLNSYGLIRFRVKVK